MTKPGLSLGLRRKESWRDRQLQGFLPHGSPEPKYQNTRNLTVAVLGVAPATTSESRPSQMAWELLGSFVHTIPFLLTLLGFLKSSLSLVREAAARGIILAAYFATSGYDDDGNDAITPLGDDNGYGQYGPPANADIHLSTCDNAAPENVDDSLNCREMGDDLCVPRHASQALRHGWPSRQLDPPQHPLRIALASRSRPFP